MSDIRIYNIGIKIKKLRKNNKLTQKQLATLTNLSEVTINRYENNSKIPTLENFLKLVDALNTSANYLLNINTDKHPVLDEITDEQIETLKNMLNILENNKNT